MKTKYLFCFIAAVAMLTIVSCAEEIVPDETLEQNTGVKTYTMSVIAGKGAVGTKALDLANGTLNATWTDGDIVSVYENSTLLGQLTAQDVTSDGTSCVLRGTLDTAPAGSALTLKYLSPDYTGQDGTLAYIAANCDYAEANVTVTVSGSSITSSNATFVNQQAIVKFTLKEGGADLPDNPDYLTVSNNSEPIARLENIPAATYTTNGDGVLYVAVPGISSGSVTLTAYVNGQRFSYTKSTGITLTNGKYYAITVKMTNTNVVDLAYVKRDITLTHGTTVISALTTPVKVSIAEDATITLNNANINVTEDANHNPAPEWKTGNHAGITCLGNAIINITGDEGNRVYCFSDDYHLNPGIFVPNDKTLTIKTLTINGTGSLFAYGNASGIGSGENASGNETCGNIEIQGGTIYAYGGGSSAGIGGDCGDITISGGIVKAWGGPYGAGIGSGSGEDCGTISIIRGTVYAWGGEFAAGIGSGYEASCDDITIATTVKEVTASKGDYAPNSIGPGSSSPSAQSSCGTVTIGGTEYPSYITTSPFTYPTPTP